MKKAFITGITGQDGSYLAELLLSQDYEVHGLVRRNSSGHGSSLGNIRNIQQRLFLHVGDILDCHRLIRICGAVKPDEIYHLAAQSHVTRSFEMVDYTLQVNIQGTLNVLHAIEACDLLQTVRLYNASTSEMFGCEEKAQSVLNESSPFAPRSPYGISKLAAYWLVRNFREAHGLYAVNGILFNHESARRGSGFVTKRIAQGAARYATGNTEKPLTLAGIDMSRDWGHARDYVRGMWLMLQQEQPTDMILATGSCTSVQQFVEIAFKHVGVTIRWVATEDHVTGINTKDGSVVVRTDASLQRAAEVHTLQGDSSYARRTLGWVPEISLEDLVAEMVEFEMNGQIEV